MVSRCAFDLTSVTCARISEEDDHIFMRMSKQQHYSGSDGSKV